MALLKNGAGEPMHVYTATRAQTAAKRPAGPAASSAAGASSKRSRVDHTANGKWHDMSQMVGKNKNKKKTNLMVWGVRPEAGQSDAHPPC